MWNNTVIIVDFAKTITSSKNPTTWSVFAKSGILWNEYINERNDLFNQYINFELDWNIEETKNWWKKHMELFVKYGLNKKIINNITNSNDYFEPRDWLKDFLYYIQTNNLDLKIISSWISDFVESFLIQNWINNSKVKIIANKLNFNTTWDVIWYDKNSIVTTLNKNEHNLDLSSYKKVFLIWDDISDLKMYNWSCTKIWFCEQEKVKWYDIYLWKNWNLSDVLKYIN